MGQPFEHLSRSDQHIDHADDRRIACGATANKSAWARLIPNALVASV